MKLKTLIISILALTLSSCGSFGTSETRDTQNDFPNENAPATFDGTSWSLSHFGNTTLPEGLAITAQFEDGRVYGSSGCNTYRGTYALDGNQITFGPLATTRMACLEPAGLMEIEQTFLEWMTDAQTFILSSDHLMILRPDGEALTFVPES